MQDPSDNHKISRLKKAHIAGQSLAREFYKDPEIYKTEIENLFLKHWLFAGHVSQIPNPGDFILCEFDTESVIVVRSKSDEIKAHINVCRHRGSKICLEKSGHKKHFSCPYHAWTYDLDGRLVSNNQMPEYFKPDENSLHQVHVQLVRGLIFICLAEAPLSLECLNEQTSEVFDLLELQNLKLAKKTSYPIAANWKLAVENYQECYHCAPSHKEFSRIHAMARPLEVFQKRKEEFNQVNPPGGLMTEINAYFDLARPGDEGFQYGRNPLVENMRSGSKDGSPLAPLLGKLPEYTGGASELMIGPLMYFLIYDDHMVGYRFLPLSQSECVCDIYWFVRSDAREGIDYDISNLTWLWDVTTKADQQIIENNQKGVNSRYYSSGTLSEMEHFLQSFLRWYLVALS